MKKAGSHPAYDNCSRVVNFCGLFTKKRFDEFRNNSQENYLIWV